MFILVPNQEVKLGAFVCLCFLTGWRHQPQRRRSGKGKLLAAFYLWSAPCSAHSTLHDRSHFYCNVKQSVPWLWRISFFLLNSVWMSVLCCVVWSALPIWWACWKCVWADGREERRLMLLTAEGCGEYLYCYPVCGRALRNRRDLLCPTWFHDGAAFFFFFPSPFSLFLF